MTALFFKFLGKSIKICLKNFSSCDGIVNRTANFHTTNENFQLKCNDGPVFTTRLALPPDYDNVVDFMCEAYYKHEPVVINIGLTDPVAHPVWRRMMRYQVSSGLSIIAENRDHCIIGAALNIKTNPWEGERMRELARCCASGAVRRIVEFFGYVAAESNLWERYCVHTIFEQSSLAVSSDYQGLGIARRLVLESWFLARDCGYRLLRMDCNSRYCARICEGFGWEQVWSIPFSQYMHNGEIVFKHVKEPHTVCRVFVDTLRYCKTYCPPYKHCKKVTPSPGEKT